MPRGNIWLHYDLKQWHNHSSITWDCYTNFIRETNIEAQLSLAKPMIIVFIFWSLLTWLGGKKDLFKGFILTYVDQHCSSKIDHYKGLGESSKT